MRIMIIIGILFLYITLFAIDIDSLFIQIDEFHKNINDYSCYLNEYTVKGKKSIDNKWIYKYLKPGYIYMESIEGNKKGSKGFYDCISKKVTGRQGGLLRFMKLTLSLSNPLVQNERGVTIAETDWFYIINRTKNILKEDNVKYTVKKGVYDNRDVIVLHIKNIPIEKYIFDESIMYIDNGQLLGFDNYEDKQLVECVKYTDVKLNNGFKKEDLMVK